MFSTFFEVESGNIMKAQKPYTLLPAALILLILAGSLATTELKAVIADADGFIPIKWAVVVMGGYDYYRDPTYNAIQRIEKIMQGRGVPYDLFQDDAIVAPTDTPPAGKYSLQHTNGTIKYQVLILLFDYEPWDTTGVNQNYIYWAVSNGTNAVLFDRVARAVPALLDLNASDIDWDWLVTTTSHLVMKTFSDGIKNYTEGSIITLGAALQYHARIHEHTNMTLWFNKTWASSWSLGMANTTYDNGQVWYLGYSLNEFRMDQAAQKYPQTWSDWKMDFWGRAINFVLNSAERISVSILPYKRWKGAWIIRIDTDTYSWKEKFLPPESVLESGWVYDYQFSVLGYSRVAGTADLELTKGHPPGYIGLPQPSSRVMYTNVTGVLQTDEITSRNYAAIIHDSTETGSYDRMKVDFNGNQDFSDDAEYEVWENMTYPTVEGKLYWDKCGRLVNQQFQTNFSDPTLINVGWWQTPMLMENEVEDLPKWKQYGHEYGLSYSFHGWQHVPLASGSTYDTWNGTQFLLDAAYINEKFDASRYWMKDKFDGTEYGFEEDQVVISHPFDAHLAEVDDVIDSLPWVLFQYSGQMNFVGFAKKSETSKYILSSSRQEDFYADYAFTAIEDMVKTLYPVISTYTHGLGYNSSTSFLPYSDSLKPANPRDAFTFWLNAKDMLRNVTSAYYRNNRIVLEFNANTNLTDFVWRFPAQHDGIPFSTFYDSTSTGKRENENNSQYVYIEFDQGQGAQRLEVNYAPKMVNVEVSEASPPSSGTTNPTAGTYQAAENSDFSLEATPLPGFTFDHWELNGTDAGNTNPYSFNVGTSNHKIDAFFKQEVYTLTVSIVGSGAVTLNNSGPYHYGDATLLTAVPANGWSFQQWSGDLTGSTNPAELIMTGNFSVTANFAYQLPLNVGWNMISFSVIPTDTSFSSIFTGMSYYQVLTWSGTNYVTPTNAEVGRGYWVLALSPTTLNLTGLPVQSYELDLPAGWSMIGSVYNNTVDGGTVFPGYYQLLTWDGGKYVDSTTIVSGKGYWALVLEPTHIVVAWQTTDSP